jgi:hypothetical protein
MKNGGNVALAAYSTLSVMDTIKIDHSVKHGVEGIARD